tara:strand:- start:561 stop:803 length:243 start_codon:yes stop_codon:yes gene_type:complete
MVRFAPLWRHQLRDGSRRMGSALGQVLAGSSLLMRDWEPVPNGRQNLWLFVEATVVGAMVLGIFAFASFEIFQTLLNWVR